MAALKRRGLKVQGFKVGPDYIDTSYHSTVTGRSARNLDTWMLTRDFVQQTFYRASQDADICLIEGVMGLFDGVVGESDTGSTAEVAALLGAPVLLVLDVSRMARTAAAIVHGLRNFRKDVRIAAVIANRAGGFGHYEIIRSAVESACGIPVIGWLPEDADLELPERHLGLVPAMERGNIEPLLAHLADVMEAQVDLNALIRIAQSTPAMSGFVAVPEEDRAACRSDRVVMVVARDAAFNFYYEDNLDMLRRSGAEIREFRPLEGEPVPQEADGLYLGGGYPEEFVARLSQADAVRASIRSRIQEGLPTLAECGGYMYLSEAMVDDEGHVWPMVGVIPGVVSMTRRLTAMGYRELIARRDCLLLKSGESLRGHEFHYSRMDCHWPRSEDIYTVRAGQREWSEGYAHGRLLATYIHVHFGSNPAVVHRWLDACRAYRRERMT